MDKLLEKCFELVDGCAQEVVNAWGQTFPAKLNSEFKAVFDKACAYRSAKETADNHREFKVLTDEEAAREKATREAFCKEYVAFLKKHPDLLSS